MLQSPPASEIYYPKPVGGQEATAPAPALWALSRLQRSKVVSQELTHVQQGKAQPNPWTDPNSCRQRHGADRFRRRRRGVVARQPRDRRQENVCRHLRIVSRKLRYEGGNRPQAGGHEDDGGTDL